MQQVITRLAIGLVLAFSMPFTTVIAQTSDAAIPSDGVVFTDQVWAKPEDHELLARVYRPEQATGPLPVLISVHGGAWGAYDRTSGVLFDRALAATGMLVLAVDFRQSPEFQHPKGSADVAAAVRWVRQNAGPLGANAEKIGLIGSSSGGHLALLEAVRPDHESHKGTPVADGHGGFAPIDEVSGAVDYVVAMWPVSSPITRYKYAQRAGVKKLEEMSLLYFPDEAAMWHASVPRIVLSGEASDLPPILVVQPGMDSNIPQDMTFDLLKAWQARDGKVDYLFYPGAPHAFGHRPSANTTDMLAAIESFIARQYPE